MAAFDQPRIEEIETLIDFCRTHQQVFIVDFNANDDKNSLEYDQISQTNRLSDNFVDSKMIAKFLKQCGYTTDLIGIKQLSELDEEKKFFSRFRKHTRGIIIPYVKDISIPKIQKITNNNYDYYFISEYNTRTICYKMTPRSVEMFWLEVNLADNCDLNCQCCDHFSPLADKCYLDPVEYKRDIERIAQLTNGKIGIMKLQGGEPLLCEDINEIVRITRNTFPDSVIWMFTAGIRLLKWETHPKGNLWKTLKECNVQIELTVYPINLNYQLILDKAKEYGVAIRTNTSVGDRTFSYEKYSVKHPFDLEGKQEKYRFISCYQFNEVIVLRHGRIYNCPMTAYIEYFNKGFNQNLQTDETDYIDIYKAKNYEEIAEFCTHRTNFCRYCAVQCRHPRKWARSKREIGEYILTEEEIN